MAGESTESNVDKSRQGEGFHSMQTSAFIVRLPTFLNTHVGISVQVNSSSIVIMPYGIVDVCMSSHGIHRLYQLYHIPSSLVTRF